MINIGLQFKTQKQEEEFYQADARAQALALLAAFTMKKLWNYQAVVTSIKRTVEENKVAGGKPASPHLDWRAIDIRLHDFPAKDHVGVLVDLLNLSFPRNDGLVTALAHGEGSNFHLHLQVPKVRKF